MPTALSTTELAGALAVADRDAAGYAASWRDAYDRHFDEIHRVIYRCGVAPADVEDLTQTVFLRAFQRTDRSPNGGGNVRPWLYGIALRVVSEHRRWHRIRRVKDWLLQSTLGASTRVPATPEEESHAHETQRRVGAVLAKMSPKLASVLVLRDIDERDLGEVALALGIPENTVRSRLRLAREKFESLWNEQQAGAQTAPEEPPWT